MDGTEQYVSALCPRRATRRIFPPLASCKPSTSAHTGTPKAATARAIAYTYAMCRSQVPAFFDYPRERPLEIGEWRKNRRLARVENDVPVDNPVCAVQPECRSKTPLDAIADHRSTQRLWHREPDAHSCRISFAPRQTKRGEQRTGYSGTVIIDCSEIGGAQNARRSRKRLRAAGAGFNGSSGQLFRRSPSIYGGPARGGATARRGRSSFPSGTGIRGSSRACDYSAEMYVSALSFFTWRGGAPIGKI